MTISQSSSNRGQGGPRVNDGGVLTGVFTVRRTLR